jgi:hypothetical protein
MNRLYPLSPYRNLAKRSIIIFALAFCSMQMFAQIIKYTNGNDRWNADSLGNQRAVVNFNGAANIAKVIIQWRRRDEMPEKKRIIVQDGQTKQRILNVKVLNATKESGEIYFEPTSGNAIYYVYYMPYKNEGRSNYPHGVYLKPDTTASESWLQKVKNFSAKQNAYCNEIQYINQFNNPSPMEVTATKNEMQLLRQKYQHEAFLVFPEDRQYSIRMNNELPQRWIEKGPMNIFNGEADQEENYAFQLGVYALKDLQNVQISFTDLKKADGEIISAKGIACLNTNGVAYNGSAFTKKVDVAADKVQAFWCTLKIPENISAGIYKGIARVSVEGDAEKDITISITVSNSKVVNSGVDEPQKMTRLNWLNSTLAQDNTVIAPYSPLQVNGNVISLSGRKIELNDDGFPKQIQTFFTEEMTGYSPDANNELYEAIHFHFARNDNGKYLQWKNTGIKFIKQEQGTVQWESISTNDTLQMAVSASLEFDGFISYTVKVTALEDAEIKNISMHIPFKKEMAKYMMGLGQKGGLRPKNFEWKWDVANKNQDGAWIGNVNAGLQYSLRDEKYSRPLNTNFYLQKPLLLPASWGNENKGGINITEKDSTVLIDNYSGPHSFKKGDVLYFNFNLLVTPFHPINTDFQWSNRFYHSYNNLDSIKATGATVVNIHHATPINPWINYPFIEWKKMKNYIDSAHTLGLKVKIYNTIRELSDHAYETFALRSLGHEVYSSGKGGGFSWLQEHLGDDYIAAWFVPEIKDAAIVNSGMNRWHNYYVEGMNWLVNKVGIDGIYLDDVAFDRVTMKRIKRVLTQNNHSGIIDLHSANQYNKSDGFNNSAMLYMEHFPYLNRLWFGEYFDYEKNSPDFFLTEVSGIPFGLMGEMLQGGGNAWRGMIYGMTNRMPWSDNADPRPIWKLWDDIGMSGTEMIGYWSSHCPVKTTNDRVLATVYKKKGIVLISIASWADDNTNVQLQINWKELGIDSAKATITAPEIKNFQPGHVFLKDEKLPVGKNKGWLIVVKE